MHPDYRSGAIITLLWAGLAEFIANTQARYVIGCPSICLADGGHNAARICDQLQRSHMAPQAWHVVPRIPLQTAPKACSEPVVMPPLVKGYLRAGALVCGPAAWDRDFNSADLFMILPMDRLDARYARHFLRV